MAGTRILWHWYTLGHYHYARMSALARQPGVELTLVETTSADDHEWTRGRLDLPFQIVTLSHEKKSAAVHERTAAAYREAIERLQPDVLVESGYAERHSRDVAVAYAMSHPEMLLLMWSETTVFDHRRSWIREQLKRGLVAPFDGAMVAGTPHVTYMESLGMSPEKIAIIGGSVDNQYFRQRADRCRQQPKLRVEAGLPEKYFVYVGRLVVQKNVPFLLDAFDRYRRAAAARGQNAWDLVIVGDGLDGVVLRAMARDRGIPGVHFTGMLQPDALPACYAFAGCFVLPSYSEPWGLVVNEAMASGTPVLISTQCGSAPDLVEPGVSGFLFDPASAQDLAAQMELVSGGEVDLNAIVARGYEKVARFSSELHGERAWAFIEKRRKELAGRSTRGGLEAPVYSLASTASNLGQDLLKRRGRRGRS